MKLNFSKTELKSTVQNIKTDVTFIFKNYKKYILTLIGLTIISINLISFSLNVDLGRAYIPLFSIVTINEFEKEADIRFGEPDVKFFDENGSILQNLNDRSLQKPLAYYFNVASIRIIPIITNNGEKDGNYRLLNYDCNVIKSPVNLEFSTIGPNEVVKLPGCVLTAPTSDKFDFKTASVDFSILIEIEENGSSRKFEFVEKCYTSQFLDKDSFRFRCNTLKLVKV